MNDNWRTTQETALVNAGMAPAHDKDAALITRRLDRQLHLLSCAAWQ